MPARGTRYVHFGGDTFVGPFDRGTARSSQGNAVTGADGAYALHGVQCDVALVVTARSAEHQLARSSVLRLAAGEIHSGVELTLVPGAALAVTVVRANGQPATACSVRLIAADTGRAA